MSFAIPEPYVWDESFRVDYENLDSEHKELFKAVFYAEMSPNDFIAILNLMAVTAHHFGEEEGMMIAKHYPDFANHKRAHDEFITKIRSMNVPLDDYNINYAKNWLVNHIKGIDFKYKGRL